MGGISLLHLHTSTRVRTVEIDDYYFILSSASRWWGERGPAIFPRFFVTHFADTCFVAEGAETIVGFLFSFLSQKYQDEAYIQGVVVDPQHRRCGIASLLYKSFFSNMITRGVRRVTGILSPENTEALAFQISQGFRIASPIQWGQTPIIVNGLPAFPDYLGAGRNKLLLIKTLKESGA
ncbi:MAG: GNAT family N-acetyltransferase [Candidatus Tectomicrobia bacterium]|nr:GNAT family N-acetyltransferase [Candidatus Tectomicrobia bacterium]